MAEQIIIERAKNPIFIRIVLAGILIICLLSPVLAVFFMLSSGMRPHLGIVILFLIFWGAGFFLLRVILWNTYGREILFLEKNEINYVADYKYFKDGKQKISTQNIEVEVLPDDTNNETRGRIKFTNEETEIETVLFSEIKTLNEIVTKIKSHYNL